MVWLMLLASFPLVFAPSCKKKEPPPAPAGEILRPQIRKLPTIEMSLAGQPFSIELAFKNADRIRGMMFRRSMPANTGMLFIFSQPEQRSFWMKNCLIDLDVAFLGADGRILNTWTMKASAPDAADYGSYESAGPMKYAIELPAGTLARVGLKAGDLIEFPERVGRIIPDPE